MRLVGQQAVGMYRPLKTVTGIPEDIQKARTIDVVEIHILLSVAPRRHVIERPGEFESEWSSHSEDSSTSLLECET